METNKTIFKEDNESDIQNFIMNDEQFSSPLKKPKYSISISVTRVN